MFANLLFDVKQMIGKLLPIVLLLAGAIAGAYVTNYFWETRMDERVETGGMVYKGEKYSISHVVKTNR